MSLSNAVIANVVLDVLTLGALALVCRIPFQRAFQGAVVAVHVHAPKVEAELEQRAA